MRIHTPGITISSKILLIVFAAICLCASALAQNGFPGGHSEALGPLYHPETQQAFAIQAHPGLDPVRRWNEIALNATGLDHTPVAPGEHRIFGEQFGPTRSSRAMAIVHIAMFEATNAVFGGFQSYTGLSPALPGTSANAAAPQAAHDALVALYPSQADTMDSLLAEDLDAIQTGVPKSQGINLGQRAAASILTLRANDGSARPEPKIGITFIPSNLPGKWRQDPVSLGPLALGAYWGLVTPFVLRSSSQFRSPTPPALTSHEYTEAYDEEKALGGDGTITPTIRTGQQTDIGIYWAYDGTPSLCAPPRLYNQLAVHIAGMLGTNGVQLARLLALVNTAMADAAIATWESKYYYQFWRPVTGIRESDQGTGPTGLGDGNPATIGDPTFTPLGAPASNLRGPNFTPPFPSYPSGHASFGGALFRVLRMFYGTDNIAFTFISDEFNGITEDDDGNVRPLLPRTFTSLSQAEEENGESRIYLGIHWHFDKTEGITQGQRVGEYVYQNAFLPLQAPRR
jgi:hypothetical protein